MQETKLYPNSKQQAEQQLFLFDCINNTSELQYPNSTVAPTTHEQRPHSVRKKGIPAAGSSVAVVVAVCVHSFLHSASLMADHRFTQTASFVCESVCRQPPRVLSIISLLHNISNVITSTSAPQTAGPSTYRHTHCNAPGSDDALCLRCGGAAYIPVVMNFIILLINLALYNIAG
jgi:hypothetical protein